MEDLLDDVRGGKIPLTPNIIDILLKSIDIVKTLLNDSLEGHERETGYENEVIELIKAVLKGDSSKEDSVDDIDKAKIEDSKPKTKLAFNEYERFLIKNAYLKGYSVYEVYIRLNSSNPMKTVSGLQVHSQIKEVADILKSSPDIDDLMSDQFYEEVLFIVQSTASRDEVYSKVFLSDVTDLVEVSDFSEDFDIDKDKDKDKELVDHKTECKMVLTNDDLSTIKSFLQKGSRVFKILVVFDETNPMRGVSGVLFYTMLKTKGDVLRSIPTYDDFKEDTFYDKGEFILVTNSNIDELRAKLYLSDVTITLKFQEFEKDMADETIAPDSTEVKPIPNEKKPGDTKPSVPLDKSLSVEASSIKPIISQSPNRKSITSVLRVESSRIDEMLNLVGELVIIKASFSQLNDDNLAIFDDLITLNVQYKDFIRQLLDDIDEILKKTETDDDKAGEYVEKLKKIELQDRIEPIIGHFDKVFPKYREVQEKLKRSTQNLGRITDDLQESVMKVRMVPINQIFSRFPRLIRDISKNLNKNINLSMYGEDTELDKSVVEDLVDPLIHIVRNAVDHGIELPDERIKKGKEETGSVELKAEHEGNTVAISIKDDGRGLSLSKIRKKAIDNKLIEANQELSNEELVNLIFHPGFSTATEVTSISGRGVGLDVVKKKIENIGGAIEITSEEGKGSNFGIKIPLTLAIIQALLVQVNNYIYSIPINSVLETLRVSPEDVKLLENTEVIRVREEILSLVQLDYLFKHRLAEREGGSFYVIVVGISGKKMALGVDSLLGEQDVVIKPLNNRYTNVKGIAGATILGDGQISLVLDVGGIFHLVSTQKRKLYDIQA